jgi:hypothetical protein
MRMDDAIQARERAAETRAAANAWSRRWTWPSAGWTSGFLGAFVIALFFFVIDWIAGRPLWTPAALGSALFLGERLAPDVTPPLALVAGYTGIHFLAFAGIGLITSALLSEPPRKPGTAGLFGIGLAIFVACQLTFVVFALLFSPTLFSDLGITRITAANALAAAAMTAFIVGVATPLEQDRG